MAILNPSHLLDQADRLAATPSVGRPRQVDLRRAVSSAYYAVFHAVITAAADEFVGATLRGSREYGLVIRSVDHGTIKTACLEVTKTTLSARYRPYIPDGGFGPHAIAFATAFPDLQEERHSADYDTLRRYTTSDARSIVLTARATIEAFEAMSAGDRKALLYLLLFPPRR